MIRNYIQEVMIPSKSKRLCIVSDEACVLRYQSSLNSLHFIHEWLIGESFRTYMLLCMNYIYISYVSPYRCDINFTINQHYILNVLSSNHLDYLFLLLLLIILCYVYIFYLRSRPAMTGTAVVQCVWSIHRSFCFKSAWILLLIWQR